MRRIFITVAEVSGDRHAAQLIRSLKRLDPSLIIEGLGGPEMIAAGATIHRDTVARAAMGWRGALRAFEMMRLLRWTRQHFAEHRPDLLIGVDSPSMNFHFQKIARQLGIPTLQYVAPQLWAWAGWRMKKLRDRVDRLACILPFEESYFREHGVNATFVGHPLFDELPSSPSPHRAGTEGRVRVQAGRNADAPVVGLLPGSRKSEAQDNFPHMLIVANAIRSRFPAARFLVPTTSATDPVVRGFVGTSPNATSLEFAHDSFDRLVPQCDLCIVVSGTATLHVAAHGVPMIVVYRVNPLTWHLAGRWVVRARTMALVNVLNIRSAPRGQSDNGHIVPEFIPWLGPEKRVADLAIDLLQHPEKLAAQREKLGELVNTLDRPGASDQVAKIAMEMMRPE
jgi:lipid-A-disaccharide synthase